MTLPTAFLTSNSQYWMTPPKILKALASEFHFVLDTCASTKSAQCPIWYDEEQNAFNAHWFEDALWWENQESNCLDHDPRPLSAWCNPPYGEYRGKRVGDWVEKGYLESLKGLTTVFLLPCNKQDQDWYHDLALPHADIRPCRGRIHFLDPETGKRPVKWSETRQAMVQDGNSQGSTLIIFGPEYKPRAPQLSFDVPAD